MVLKPDEPDGNEAQTAYHSGTASSMGWNWVISGKRARESLISPTTYLTAHFHRKWPF